MSYMSYVSVPLSIAYLVARTAAGVIVAIHMYRDSSGRRTRFLSIPPKGWALIGFAGPVFGLATYWLTNYYGGVVRSKSQPEMDSEISDEDSQESV
jgi:hypothetical protein